MKIESTPLPLPLPPPAAEAFARGQRQRVLLPEAYRPTRDADREAR